MSETASTRDRLFEQFSQQIVNDGWAGLSCAELAGQAGVEVKIAFVEFRNRYAYVTELIRRIDKSMLESYDPSMGEEAARERLFDVLMARFDAMQDHRPLVTALSKAARRDPLLSLHLLALSRLTSDWIMDMAHISPAGVGGMVRSKGAMAAYTRAFAAWLEDDSEDMAKTMAVLDKTLRKGEKALKRAEKLACALPRLRRKCRNSASRSARKSDDDGAGEPVVDDTTMEPMPS